MDKQIITFSANEQNLVRIGGEYHYSSNKVSYIGAHFDLGTNWDGFDGVRAVWFTDRINGISTVLDGEGNCTVPTEVLKKKDRVFVNLVGSIVSNGELTDRLTTYPAVALVVDSKAKVDSTETAPVTPSQFEQFVSIVQDAVANIKDIVSTTLNADYTLTFVYSDGTSYTTPSIRGERGPQGADGADGTDGNGIASAVLNSNYTLTLTFTDGTSYTTPSIRGAQGPKGDPGDVSQAQLDAAVSDLKSDLERKTYYLSKDEESIDVSTQIEFINTGKSLDTSGNLVSSTYDTSDYIDLNGVTGIYRTGTETKFTLYRYCFYDEDKQFLSVGGDTTDYEIVDYGDLRVTWLTLNPNARYIRIVVDPTRGYSYYTVTQEPLINSYTMPPIIINDKNIYEAVGDGEYAKDVVDEITELEHGDNILDPSLLINAGYYYDFSDGVTHVESNYGKITEEYIAVTDDHIFVRQIYDSTSTNILLVYCYDASGNYLGYSNWTYKAIAETTTSRALKTGTRKIKLYTNAPTATGDDICISMTQLDAFEEYETFHVVKKSALPNLDTGTQYLPLYGKVIANFGDSVFGNKRPPNDISTALANITGATVYNLGFGGCRMSQHSTNWDAFSMYRLADAIATNNFSVQDAVNVDNVSGMPQYFKETRTLLESIDFNNVDIITISYGTNDFTAGVSLDNSNNLYDTTSFGGALRYSLEKILEAYPQLHIFVCTPTWRFWMDSNNEFLYDSDTHEVNGNLLTAFVEIAIDISKAYHLKSIDNYFELGIDKFNRSHWFPTGDGTHHNRDGGVLIAQHMAIEMF